MVFEKQQIDLLDRQPIRFASKQYLQAAAGVVREGVDDQLHISLFIEVALNRRQIVIGQSGVQGSFQILVKIRHFPLHFFRNTPGGAGLFPPTHLLDVARFLVRQSDSYAESYAGVAKNLVDALQTTRIQQASLFAAPFPKRGYLPQIQGASSHSFASIRPAATVVRTPSRKESVQDRQL
jgi:hypothetical protein